jgi:transposase-like protein/IS1 family transposase
MQTCLCCSGPIKKSGRFSNRNRVVQRFACTRCGKTFSEEQPLAGTRIETAKAAFVCQLLCEGVGIRAISRLTQLPQQTVLNVLQSTGDQCVRLLDAKVRNVQSEQIELDELHSFVRTRPDNTEKDDGQHGAFFMYLALDRDSKLIITHLVAKRDGENAGVFLRDLKGRVTSRFQLSTDGWLGYTGWKVGVRSVFGDDGIDYGFEIKEFGNVVSRLSTKQPVPRRFNPIVVKWVKRGAVTGSPDLETINTSRVERLNLSVRLFNRRFTRLTLGYSKTLEKHRAAAALFVAYNNFCRKHSAHGKTPAHEAGITDRTWTVTDLLEAKQD